MALLTSFCVVVPIASAGAPDFTPATPARLLDTRPGSPTIDGQASGGGTLTAGATLMLTVAGRAGVPLDAAAAVLNITSTAAAGPGYLTVWPCGAPQPLASSLNFSPGRDVANAVLTKLGTNGQVCIYAGAADTHVVADVTGWFPAGSSFVSASPARLLDTRPGSPTIDGQASGQGAIAAGATLVLTVAGRAGVPVDAGAAVLNITSTAAAGPGYLTVWPCGAPQPLASSLNFSPGRDVANAVLTKLGTNGTICIYAGAADSHVVADITGWFPTGSSFVSATPARLLDTRPGSPTIDGQAAGYGALAAGATLVLSVAGRAGVPSDTGAAVLNITSAAAAGPGYLTVWPCGRPRPLASSLNFSPGRDVANAVLTQLGPGGTICIYAGVSDSHVVADVTGWFDGVPQAVFDAVRDPSAPPPVTTPLPQLAPGQWQPVNNLPSEVLDNSNPANYGTQTLGLSLSDPRVVYLGTSNHGIWKTTDTGNTWTKVNVGQNGANLDSGRNWTMAVDPTNPNVLYTVAGFGVHQGLWKSVNGGVDWAQMLPDAIMTDATPDIYSVAIDPNDHQHLLLGSHSPWSGGGAGVLESPDGGTTWTAHHTSDVWNAEYYALFIDSTTWLVTTKDHGFWRTSDSGQTWIPVSTHNMQNGGNQLYRTSDGTLYAGAVGTLLRSTDSGLSWVPVGPPNTRDGYNAVIGDGTQLWAQAANAPTSTVTPQPPYFTSLEADGTAWSPYRPGDTAPKDGPLSMVFDPVNRILYSSNWLAGVWRLKL
jgi:zinc transporter ZupT/photosystem II stability/assembly factor-like uncharacterized protein